MEIEECKCIYRLLIDIVSYMRLIQPFKTRCDKSSQRGLPSLHCVFAKSLTTPSLDWIKWMPIKANTSSFTAISRIKSCFEPKSINLRLCQRNKIRSDYLRSSYEL